MRKNKNALREVHARLFDKDVRTLQRLATEEGIAWQIKLRLLVRNALIALEVPIIDIHPKRGTPDE